MATKRYNTKTFDFVVNGEHVYFTCDHLCDGCPHKRTYQNQAGDRGCFGEYGESFFAFEDFGKTVFITREEAEQTLKDRCMKND